MFSYSPVDLAVHEHACALYDTRDELRAFACEFLKEGLERKEQCHHVTEQSAPADFVAFLKSEGVDADKAMADGSLRVLSGSDLRRQLGGFTPDRMLSFLALAEQNAKDEGFAVLRWSAEMTWLSKDNITPADFFSFESRLGELIRERDIVAMCEYTKEDFGPEILIAAAETHPLFVYKDLVCTNHYYIPAEELLKPAFLEMKWQRMIGNIVTRERLMQGFLSETPRDLKSRARGRRKAKGRR